MNKEEIIFSTTKGNHYMYSPFKNNIFFCHPELKQTMEKDSFGLEPNNEADDYYVKKLNFLKKNALIKNHEDDSIMNSFIKGDDIKREIANLNVLTIEVTEACNLNCKYCAYGEYYNPQEYRNRKTIDINNIIKLLQYLQQLWDSELNVSTNKIIYIGFYGGEPLLGIKLIKEVVNYIKHIKLNNSLVRFNMTTNGVLLDKHIDYLVKEDFNLLISLDGNEKNNAYRLNHNGKNLFQTIFKNIQSIQKNYPDYFNSNVQFNSVLHNLNSVKDIYGFIKSEFNKTARIAPLSTSGIVENKKNEFWQTYVNIKESLYHTEDYRKIEDDMFLNMFNPLDCAIFLDQYSGNCYSNYNKLLFENIYTGKLPTGTCFPFNRKMFLTAQGKILQCERIDFKYELAQVNANGVEINYDAIAQKINNYYDKMRKQCDACYKIKSCVQCMFQIDQLNNKPVCDGLMNAKKFGEYLSDSMVYLEENRKIYNRIMTEVIFK